MNLAELRPVDIELIASVKAKLEAECLLVYQRALTNVLRKRRES
jgi:hypothetical protein